MPSISDIVMYDREVIRTCQCWRCKHRGEYEWRTDRYPNGFGPKIPNSKKMYCNKTKRWGSTTRAYYCKHFESNSDS